MNTLPAQEIKRRGIAAVDELISKGDVHVIRNNQPQYVILSEVRYQELIVAEQEACYARVRASLEDVKGGRVKRGTANDLIKELKLAFAAPKFFPVPATYAAPAASSVT